MQVHCKTKDLSMSASLEQSGAARQDFFVLNFEVKTLRGAWEQCQVDPEDPGTTKREKSAPVPALEESEASTQDFKCLNQR